VDMNRRSFLKTAIAGVGILVTGVGASSFIMREDGSTLRLDHVDIGLAYENVRVGDLVGKPNNDNVYGHVERMEDVIGVVENISMEKSAFTQRDVKWVHVCKTGKALVNVTT